MDARKSFRMGKCWKLRATVRVDAQTAHAGLTFADSMDAGDECVSNVGQRTVVAIATDARI